MYKARSASYQRGMGRSGEGLTLADRAQFVKTQISKEELAHFSFGERTRDAMLDELEPLLRTYARNGFKSPKDVARLLNKAGIKTACGKFWTPQLAWFLQGFLFEKRELRRATSGQPPMKVPAKSPIPSTTAIRGPLTPDEMARRLSALGRVTLIP